MAAQGGPNRGDQTGKRGGGGGGGQVGRGKGKLEREKNEEKA
jgi:hypothetical protein